MFFSSTFWKITVGGFVNQLGAKEQDTRQKIISLPFSLYITST